MSTLERIFKLVFGLLLVIAALFLVARWWPNFIVLLKGSVPIVLGLVGLVFLLLGFEK